MVQSYTDSETGPDSHINKVDHSHKINRLQPKPALSPCITDIVLLAQSCYKQLSSTDEGVLPRVKEMNFRMNRRRRVYEGKAKVLFEGPEPGTLVQYFKDDASAFHNMKKGTITGKGVLNNRISEYLMVKLGEIGVPTHFMKRLNMREQLIRKVEIIPVEVVVRNIVAGSLSKRLGIPEGTVLPRSIVEFYLKKEELENPMVSDEHITAFGWANPQEIDEIMALSLRINDYLSGLFLGIGLKLVDFKLEFGRLWDNDELHIILADEISPDNCRLWDVKTNEKMDKDRFRRDLGKVEEAYQEVAKRLGIMPENMNTEPSEKPS